MGQRQVQIATWTGRRDYIPEMIGGGSGYNCEYQLRGQRFWHATRGACPAQVTVN